MNFCGRPRVRQKTALFRRFLELRKTPGEGYVIKRIVCLAFFFLFAITAMDAHAQRINTIREITVESNVPGVERLVENQCGLTVGSVLSRDSAAEAVKRLWYLGIFSDVVIEKEDTGNGIEVIIRVVVLPSVNNITTEGFDEVKEEDALNTIKLSRHMKIGERKIAKMQKQILEMYEEKGFLRANVDISMTPAPDDSTLVDIAINVNEGKKIKIKTINIEGNENLSDRDIKKKMETKEHRWYRSGEYKEDVLEEDKKTIVTFYKTQGYRDAAVVRDSVYFDEENDKINLTIFVNEGKKYYFGSSAINGTTEFGEEELRQHIEFQPGDTFNEMQVDMAAFNMQKDYNNRGFLQAQVNPVQYAHGDTVDIHYEIDEWNKSKIARVIIEGNTKTHEKVIRREIELVPGDDFNREKLERSYRDIMALNYFDPSGVNFEYEDAEEEDMVNIKFKVKEKSTGIAQVGAGYSERDRLVGTLAFSNSNLFGRGQSINFNWDMGSRRRAFQIYFTEPWLFDTRTIFSFSLYNILRSDYTSAFDQEKRRGGYVRLGRELKWPDYSRAYITYRLEDVDYSNPSYFYTYYLVTGKTSSLSLSFSRDSTDLPQFASEGSKTFATVEVAGGPFGGDLSYYKYYLINEVYLPVFWKISLVSRSRLGYLKGYKESVSVPYSERFMPGGTSFDGMVRGYPNREVSPRVSGEEVGGETMFVNNFELQIPIIANMVSGILFYDVGNAWRNLSETNPFELKRSAGVGVRLYVPQLGLVGFDFGYGFDKLDGARDIGGWRTHFQFGNFNNMYY